MDITANKTEDLGEKYLKKSKSIFTFPMKKKIYEKFGLKKLQQSKNVRDMIDRSFTRTKDKKHFYDFH